MRACMWTHKQREQVPVYPRSVLTSVFFLCLFGRSIARTVVCLIARHKYGREFFCLMLLMFPLKTEDIFVWEKTQTRNFYEFNGGCRKSELVVRVMEIKLPLREAACRTHSDLCIVSDCFIIIDHQWNSLFPFSYIILSNGSSINKLKVSISRINLNHSKNIKLFRTWI